MAKDTAKRNAKKNAARIQNFRVITLSLLAISIAFYWMYDGFPGWRGWMLFAFWFSQEWYAISLLAARGAPATDPSTGDIVDCVDLSEVEQLGFFSYAQDCLWVCWFVQLLSAVFSAWFALLYSVVPMYALWKAWSTVLSPLLSMYFARNSSQTPQNKEEDDPRERLRRRRDEARGVRK